jgi:hypothetical protein
MKLCTVSKCRQHRDDPTWRHIPRRDTTPTVHLRAVK